MNGKKKNKWIQITRRVLQILSFLILPGLFASTFGAVKLIFCAVLQGKLQWETISGAAGILLATIPATILFGRFFCGFFCGFGAMEDFLWFLSDKLIFKKQGTRIEKLHISAKADRVLKYVKYAVLLFSVTILWTGAFELKGNTPWTVFGIYSSLGNWSGYEKLLTFGGILLILIMIASFFVERFFCRYLCPMGAIYSLLARLSPFGLEKERSSCGSCQLCTRQCSMEIAMHATDKVTTGECIRCLKCMEVCPKEHVRQKPEWISIAAIVVTMITVAVSSLLPKTADNLVSESVSETVSEMAGEETASETAKDTADTETESETEEDTTGAETAESIITVADGTYSGSAEAYRGPIEVSVTVEGGKVSDISILSSYDNEEYLDRVIPVVVKEIKEQQSLHVDAVSGATYSSNGIIKAVANALNIPEDSLTLTEGKALKSSRKRRG